MGLDTNVFFRHNQNAVESPTNALMRGLEIQRAQQGNALQQFQFQQARRQAEMQEQENALRQRFVIGENRPGDGVGPTQEAGYDFNGYATALARIDPMRALQMKAAMQKEQPAPVVVGANASLVNPRTGKPIFQAPPKPEAENQFIALLKKAGIDPASPQGQKFLSDRLVKESTHAPAPSQVTYAGPVPFMLPDGSVGYAQPGNRPGAQPQVMMGPDGKPLVKPGESTKPLTGGVLKQVTEARDNAATISRLESSFKPEYAGKGVLGLGADTSMIVKGNLGFDQDAVEWWKNYRKQAELIERHSLFGAALTPTEQASWRSADIGPGMDAGVIKRNLETRRNLANQVLDFTRQDLIDAGSNEDRINKIAGRKAAPATKDATKTVVRTGTLNGRKVVQYSDGSTAYAD